MRLVNNTIYFLAKSLRQLGVEFNVGNDPRVKQMKQEIQEIGGGVEFKIEQYPDGSWTAESTNLDGIITGGKNTQKISFIIKDAIFTYFGIPPYLCGDGLLHADNEPVILKQRVYV